MLILIYTAAILFVSALLYLLLLTLNVIANVYILKTGTPMKTIMLHTLVQFGIVLLVYIAFNGFGWVTSL